VQSNSEWLLQVFIEKTLNSICKKITLPRIININEFNDLITFVTFNNGETRKIDLLSVFSETGFNRSSPACVLTEPATFAQAQLRNATFSWDLDDLFITSKKWR